MKVPAIGLQATAPEDTLHNQIGSKAEGDPKSNKPEDASGLFSSILRCTQMVTDQKMWPEVPPRALNANSASMSAMESTNWFVDNSRR